MENEPSTQTTGTALALLNDNLSSLTNLVVINTDKTESEAEKYAIREILNYEIIASERMELQNLDQQSVLLAVKQCILDNLTLNKNSKLVYLYPGKVKVGQNGSAAIYKDVLVYDPTHDGLLSIAYQKGTILDHKRPTCTFDGDGKVDTVTFQFLVPSYNQPRWESVTFTKTDFARWEQKSKAKFGTANANYTLWKGSIDPEFAGSKSIKHALKKRGTNPNFNPSEKMAKQNNAPVNTFTEDKKEVVKETKNSEKNYTDFEEIPEKGPDPIVEKKKTTEFPPNEDLF